MLVKMETYFDGEMWCAKGIGEDIFIQGSTLDELYDNITEAVLAHYGETLPKWKPRCLPMFLGRSRVGLPWQRWRTWLPSQPFLWLGVEALTKANH